MDRLPLLFGDFECACKELLLLQTEQLLVGQFVLPAAGALQESQMKHDYIVFVSVEAVEDRVEVVQSVVVAHHHKRIALPYSKLLGRQIVACLEIELVQFRVFRRSPAGRLFRDRENREEYYRETHAGNRSDLLRQE